MENFNSTSLIRRSLTPNSGYIISVNRAGTTDTQTSLRPQAVIVSPIKVRAGPGTKYVVTGTAEPGELFPSTGKSPGAGDWWQISYGGRTGWVYGPLVTATNAHGVEVVDPP